MVRMLQPIPSLRKRDFTLVVKAIKKSTLCHRMLVITKPRFHPQLDIQQSSVYINFKECSPEIKQWVITKMCSNVIS